MMLVSNLTNIIIFVKFAVDISPIMKRLSVISLSVILLCVSCSTEVTRPYTSYLDRLDETIARADEYVNSKEQRISSIENMLHSRGVTPFQQYQIYGRLYAEYLPFQFDKAKQMLEHQERLAEDMNSLELKNDALLEKAMMLTMAGFFHEAEFVFEKLDTTTFDTRQMVSWYNARQKYLHDYHEYVKTSSFTVSSETISSVKCPAGGLYVLVCPEGKSLSSISNSMNIAYDTNDFGDLFAKANGVVKSIKDGGSGNYNVKVYILQNDGGTEQEYKNIIFK